MVPLTINEPSSEEKLLMLGSEYRLARTRFWCSLLAGLVVWPLLFFAVAAYNRMADIRTQARLIGVVGDAWMKDPWTTK